jgi:hypothetical protein
MDNLDSVKKNIKFEVQILQKSEGMRIGSICAWAGRRECGKSLEGNIKKCLTVKMTG